MTIREVLVDRVIRNKGRVLQWRFCCDLVRTAPESYKVVYDQKTVSFALHFKSRVSGKWSVISVSKGWDWETQSEVSCL